MPKETYKKNSHDTSCLGNIRGMLAIAEHLLNTIFELLETDKSIIAISRVKPVQKQLIRPCSMDELGLLKFLLPNEMSSDPLMKEVFAQHGEPANGARVKATEKINFNGLMTVSRTIETMLTGNNKHKISFKSPMNTALKLKNKPMVESCSAFS
jgi:predicted glycosyltransferase